MKRPASLKVMVTILVVVLMASAVPALAGKYSNEERTKQLAPAEEGKATIYIVRRSSMGGSIYFWTFADDRFLGVTRGPGYAWAHLEPGSYTIWSKAENVSALTLEVEAGKTYYIRQKALPGFGKARVRTELIDKAEWERLMDRVKKLSTATDAGLEKASRMPERYLDLARRKASSDDREES